MTRGHPAPDGDARDARARSAADEALRAHAMLVEAIERSIRDGVSPAWPEPLPPGTPVERVQTHISTVLLAGRGALKLKKPVSLGFLDFSTLEQREHYCREELRINQRTASALYRAVLPVTGAPDAPRIGDGVPVIDWALWMHRFDDDQLYDRLARHGRLTADHVDALANAVAGFHAAQGPSPPGYGDPDVALRWARDNLSSLANPPLSEVLSAEARAQVRDLDRWTEARLGSLRPLMERRRASGAVIEAHGDLHLGNIVQHEGRPLLFDALEFNPELRHIDRCSDVAFAFMDLLDHGLPRLAWRWLSQTLESSGDHEGLPLLRWYAVYRALVRAKVALLGALQPGAADDVRAEAVRAAERRIALASSLAGPPRPRLWVVGGLSGSGKSTVAMALVEAVGAVRVRSDVERKRLHGLAPTERPREPARIYDTASTARTYERLAVAARAALEGGIPVVVDATFNRRIEREAMRRLAASLGVELLFVDCTAPEGVLRDRLARRWASQNDASDADAVVLAQQVRHREPFAGDEQGSCVALDTDCEPVELTRRVEALVRRCGIEPQVDAPLRV